MTSTRKKYQPHHSQPDLRTGLLAPGPRPGHSSCPAGRAQGKHSWSMLRKTKEAVFLLQRCPLPAILHAPQKATAASISCCFCPNIFSTRGSQPAKMALQASKNVLASKKETIKQFPGDS